MAEKKTKLTIYDISKEAGVSIATVSRVLNGYGNVSEKTRDTVMSVMARLGYKPNAFARGLGLDSMRTVGILCADSSDPYLAKAVYYIEESLRTNGYDALLCCTGHGHAAKCSSLELLLSKKVDAAILVGSHFLGTSAGDNKYIKDAAGQIPVMLLNASLDHPGVYSFLCDDPAAVAMAAEALVTKGRRRFLYIYDSKSVSGIKKLEGFMNCMKAHEDSSLEYRLLFLPDNRDDPGRLVKSIKDVYDAGFCFDGVITSEDYLAVAALKFAIREKLDIPGEVSVIGYNNSNLSRITEPELTSVDNKLEPMCCQLVATLMGVLEGREMPHRTEYVGTLVVRGT